MEELLCDAAMRGDLESLHEIIAKDNYILDKVLVGSFKGKNPLHVATSIGQAEFVQKLLEIKPKLAKVLDTKLGAALHIASANGDVMIVEALVELSPEMCMARNRDGNNPLHIAAMEGKVDVLKKLVETCPLAAQVILDRGDTILHLCVKYNQLECLRLLLEIIRDPDFVQSKDANGNTMLHLAVFSKRFQFASHFYMFPVNPDERNLRSIYVFQIVERVLKSTRIDVDAPNGAGWTAMDIYFFVRNRSHRHEVDVWIEKFLRRAGARRRREMLVFTSQSQEKLMQTVMVVSSLFATMAFQVGVNPPGGVWQDNFKGHIAGKAMLADEYPNSYACFMFFNTVGFLLSLFLILSILATAVPVTRNPRGLLLPVISWLTIMTTAFAYTYSIIVVSPKHMMAVTNTILVSVIVWAFVMILLAVEVVAAFELSRSKKDWEMMSRLAS
ncbi:ankyrin repeat-containing protein BDA1-like [Rhododendron vialii]|uniref:ankyrin repeat-containing protein BDA1-like n=1 Tax=Rhododendron vialii TaxID=182163 RepID=UPI00265F865F|nr:ankyrin repeat-containing protein BDA1-like [Rhododendron vialii]